jgi:hypothetical protein
VGTLKYTTAAEYGARKKQSIGLHKNFVSLPDKIRSYEIALAICRCTACRHFGL